LVSAEEGRVIMTPTLAWGALILAGLLDVAWAATMKYTEGYTRLGWTVLSLALLAAFVFLLGKALQILPLGVAYSAWTGIGAVGTVLLGVVLFGEALDPLKIAAIIAIIGGVAILKFAA
jgi:quaternary ammonium compound-resistance protein SugE